MTLSHGMNLLKFNDSQRKKFGCSYETYGLSTVKSQD
jgi:hypothetical protein